MVDLLDYDVRFGQGFLFSPPRPVRAEVLQGLAERQPASARAAPPARAAERPAPLQAEPARGGEPPRPAPPRHRARAARARHRAPGAGRVNWFPLARESSVRR